MPGPQFDRSWGCWWISWCVHTPPAPQARPHLKIPGERELAAIASTCGPATILYVAKTSAYLLIQATATSMSTLALAAHQPVWSVWGLVSSPAACDPAHRVFPFDVRWQSLDDACQCLRQAYWDWPTWHYRKYEVQVNGPSLPDSSNLGS